MAQGKIARLPHEIREQLNVRMRNAEKAKPLLQWLNSLPEVQAVLATEFGGVPILKQNLSQYRRRGYRDWLNQQETLAQVQRFVSQSPESEPATPGKLSDRFVGFLLTRYALATARLGQEGADQEKEWRLLRELCHDLVALRRGDQDAEWLRLEQSRLDFQRAKHQKTPMKADRESYSPVGRGSCRAGASSAEKPGGNLATRNTLLPLPTRTSRLVGQASRLSVVGQASRLSVVGQASRLPIVGCASRRNQTQNSTKKQEADRESYRPVGRAFTTSARGSQRTSNPECQNRWMQTDSALAFGVR